MKSAAPRSPHEHDIAKSAILRVLAAILWAIAVGGESATVVWAAQQGDTSPHQVMAVVSAALLCGASATTGGLLWVQANRLRPVRQRHAEWRFLRSYLPLIMASVVFLPSALLFLPSSLARIELWTSGEG